MLGGNNYLHEVRTLEGVHCGGYVPSCVVLEGMFLGRNLVAANIAMHAEGKNFERTTSMLVVVYTLYCERG